MSAVSGIGSCSRSPLRFRSPPLPSCWAAWASRSSRCRLPDDPLVRCADQAGP